MIDEELLKEDKERAVDGVVELWFVRGDTVECAYWVAKRYLAQLTPGEEVRLVSAEGAPTFEIEKVEADPESADVYWVYVC